MPGLVQGSQSNASTPTTQTPCTSPSAQPDMRGLSWLRTYKPIQTARLHSGCTVHGVSLHLTCMSSLSAALGIDSWIALRRSDDRGRHIIHNARKQRRQQLRYMIIEILAAGCRPTLLKQGESGPLQQIHLWVQYTAKQACQSKKTRRQSIPGYRLPLAVSQVHANAHRI
jgi:hypothetical protein